MPMMTVLLALLIVLFSATADAAEQDTANSLRLRGLQMYQRGALDAAASSWAEAARGYERQGQPTELERARTTAKQSGDRLLLVSALTGLGSVSLAAGRAEEAETYLREAKDLARGDAEQAPVMNELGNVAAARNRAYSSARSSLLWPIPARPCGRRSC